MDSLNSDRQTLSPGKTGLAQPNDAGPIVAASHISRVYRVGSNPVSALRDISLEVPRGVMAAFKGRSGSGKTTLLNMIGGLDQPTSGELLLFGRPMHDFSATELTDLRRHRIGFVFQAFAIFPVFSALENVELMLRIAGVKQGRRERAMRCLEIVGLGAWAHHRPWELSGGQQQRVAIARALSTRPDLILADEPTGELDSATARQIYALFRHIVEKEGVTLIMATHDPVIEEYAHLVFELDDGQVKSVHHPVTL
jgi:ABC-type lipoprotein export system ATPase subunit